MLIEFINLASYFGSNKYLPVMLTGSLLLFFCFKKHYKEFYLILATIPSYPLALVLKQVFQQPRPSLVNVTILWEVDRYGFPSTHVFYYTVLFGALLFLSFRLTALSRVGRMVVAAISIYLLAFVGVSRVLLLAHSVNDVVWGHIFGGVYLAILIGLYLYSGQKPKLKSPKQ